MGFKARVFFVILICSMYAVTSLANVNLCHTPLANGRNLSSDEKEFLSANFPMLNMEYVRVYGDMTENYNCIAWSIGITDQWINPPDTLEEFQKFYADNNYIQVSKYSAHRVIDGWKKITVNDTIEGFTHGSRYCSNIGAGTWMSKLGDYLLISHPELDLKGEIYGDVFEGYQTSNSWATLVLMPLRDFNNI